jgi:hypothetical protein
MALLGSRPHAFPTLGGRTLEPGLAKPLLAESPGSFRPRFSALLSTFVFRHLLPP